MTNTTRDENLDLLWSDAPGAFDAAMRALGAEEYDHGAVLVVLSATVVRAPMRHFPCTAMLLDTFGAWPLMHPYSERLAADVALIIALGYPAAAAVILAGEEEIPDPPAVAAVVGV